MGIESSKIIKWNPSIYRQESFDPSDPVGYLNSFEIRANRPTRFTCLNWRRYLRYSLGLLSSETCQNLNLCAGFFMDKYTSFPTHAEQRTVPRLDF